MKQRPSGWMQVVVQAMPGPCEEGMPMKKRGKVAAAIALAVLGLSACATYPTPGPTSPAYIGDGKTQAEFAQADAYCRNLAQERAGVAPGEAATQSTAGSAVLGTLLGAGLGAGIGAAAGNPGLGAAIGAGTGALGGAAYGSAAGASSAAAVQQRYDAEYNQCMYAAGHRVRGMMAQAAPPQGAPGPPPPPPQGAPGQQPPPPQAGAVPAGDPTRGQLQNATRWRLQVFVDQDPSALSSAPFLTLNPGDVAPQNLDIGTHRIIAQAFVETQFGTRPVGQLDRSIQVDSRGAGWSLRFGEGDFR
jgi:hypothetical protein